MDRMYKSTNGLFYLNEAACPGGGTVYYLYAEAEHKAQQAAIAAEEVLNQLVARYITRCHTFTHVMGQKAEDALAQLRAVKEAEL